MLTAHVEDPAGYGRILRGQSETVIGIVEHKDATDEQRRITEINSGIIAAPAERLASWLARIDRNNASAEYYLTDVVGLAVADRVPIETETAATVASISGVNDRAQLAALERHLQKHRCSALLSQGVTLRDPARVDIRGEIVVGLDVTIDVNVVFEGKVVLEDGVTIGANCVVRDATIGSDSVVHPNCVIDGATISRDTRIGPFARLRPGANLAESVHIGNFVEVKKSVLGARSKANHLTYIGDAEVGSDVNIGAGTITCNYDGVNKHRTVIGDRAFIGSGVELVAPVQIGAGATIGAGSTISKEAPPEKLTLERAKQSTIEHWKRPKKKVT